MNIALSDGNGTFTSRILTWIAKGWEGASEAEMIAALDEETIRRISSECGIRPDQLVELAKAGPNAADEMPKMMKALGIDPMEVETRFRALFRDMQVNCAQCHSKGACRKDLAAGVAAAHFHDYCLNANDLSALRATPSVLAE